MCRCKGMGENHKYLIFKIINTNFFFKRPELSLLFLENCCELSLKTLMHGMEGTYC